MNTTLRFFNDCAYYERNLLQIEDLRAFIKMKLKVWFLNKLNILKFI